MATGADAVTPTATLSAEQRALLVRQLGAALAAVWRRAHADDRDREPAAAVDDRAAPSAPPARA